MAVFQKMFFHTIITHNELYYINLNCNKFFREYKHINILEIHLGALNQRHCSTYKTKMGYRDEVSAIFSFLNHHNTSFTQSYSILLFFTQIQRAKNFLQHIARSYFWIDHKR